MTAVAVGPQLKPFVLLFESMEKTLPAIVEG